MQTEHGDIWDYAGTHALVIPTNVGWRREGSNVMGRGVARQAAERYPALPRAYGWHCQRNLDSLLWWKSEDGTQLILFPVKPLNRLHPNLSWRGPATLTQIEASLIQLAQADTQVALPLVGCGNGGLAEEAVRLLLDRYLASDQFTLVCREQ